jgi:hypothetical protein
MPLIIAAVALGAGAITAGVSHFSQKNAAKNQMYAAAKQRSEGEQQAQEAIDKMEAINITDNQFAISQETRDLVDNQQKQFAESQKRILENQKANIQQTIANYQGDPVRMQSNLSQFLPELSAQAAGVNMELAARSTAADENLAGLAEKYNNMNLQNAIQEEMYNAELFNQLYGDMRREGVAAAGAGYAAQAEAMAARDLAAARAVDTGMSTALNTATLMVNAGTGEKGGDLEKIRTMQRGGLMDQIMRTGGEFNHDTNKKALVDEETGEKEAELTGEEVVLNPDQTERTMGAVKELFKYLETLEEMPPELQAIAERLDFFKDPQFDVMNGEDHEMLEEQV